jgi:uncharacterized repeat protein (TIGR03803 family)
MNTRRISRIFLAAIAIAAFTFSLAVRAQAQTETLLYSFGGFTGDGATPNSALIFDSAGNLYGTTQAGGIGCPNQGCGTVFQLAPASGGGWTESVLYQFTGGSDGSGPHGRLVMDAAGNLYGTTARGGVSCTIAGTQGCGVVFELSPSSTGTWTETVLYDFTGGNDGAGPLAGLVFDASGSLYGTTSYGGHSFGFLTAGAVFQLVPTSSGWQENSIYTFHGPDGAQPASTLAFDAAGILYGTTQEGGSTICSSGCGVVFKLTPTSSGPWNEKIAHYFTNTNGAIPYAGVTFDSAGNMYGTTLYGGILGLCFKSGCGTVFELSPNPTGGWHQVRTFKFVESNGYNPYAGVTLDASGNVYGTTLFGGDLTTCGDKDGCGVAYKLAPTSTGWSQTLLHVFATTTTDGDRPAGEVILDAAGNLYGTTQYGGNLLNLSTMGTVYEITP